MRWLCVIHVDVKPNYRYESSHDADGKQRCPKHAPVSDSQYDLDPPLSWRQCVAQLGNERRGSDEHRDSNAVVRWDSKQDERHMLTAGKPTDTPTGLRIHHAGCDLTIGFDNQFIIGVVVSDENASEILTGPNPDTR